jgi:hypothetical protein
VLHQPAVWTVAGASAAASTPTGAAFDIVLLVHIGCVLVAFASLLVTGTQAWRARDGSTSTVPGDDGVARYFRPGVNWPGRTLYGVLVFGFVLVAMSRGAYGLSDAFVQLGLVLWIACAALAELVVWPAERVLQRVVSGSWEPEEAHKVGSRVAISAWVTCAVMVIAIVVMFQKP